MLCGASCAPKTQPVGTKRDQVRAKVTQNTDDSYGKQILFQFSNPFKQYCMHGSDV